jgi:hypothetical protein
MDPNIYLELREVAKERGVSIQELPRAVIIPDWISDNGLSVAQSKANETICAKHSHNIPR